jgi:hypothetical protein
LVRPAILKMRGLPPISLASVDATLEERIVNDDGRRTFARVTLRRDGERWHARLSGPQGSSVLSSLVAADGLAIVPEDLDALEAGESTTVLPQMMAPARQAAALVVGKLSPRPSCKAPMLDASGLTPFPRGGAGQRVLLKPKRIPLPYPITTNRELLGAIIDGIRRVSDADACWKAPTPNSRCAQSIGPATTSSCHGPRCEMRLVEVEPPAKPFLSSFWYQTSCSLRLYLVAPSNDRNRAVASKTCSAFCPNNGAPW